MHQLSRNDEGEHINFSRLSSMEYQPRNSSLLATVALENLNVASVTEGLNFVFSFHYIFIEV